MAVVAAPAIIPPLVDVDGWWADVNGETFNDNAAGEAIPIR